MVWAFLACLLLITAFLFNMRRRFLQGRLEDAGLNLAGAVAATIAGLIIVQFV